MSSPSSPVYRNLHPSIRMPLHNIDLPPCPLEAPCIEPHTNENLDIMLQWYKDNFPDEPTNHPKLPLLRCCSGDTTQYDTPWDWANMLISYNHRSKKENDKKMTMKMIARDAIMYGITCIDEQYMMPRKYLLKYNTLFMKLLK